MHLVLSEGSPSPISQCLLLANFFLKELFADMGKITVFLFGIYSFEKRAGVNYILAFGRVYLFFSDSDREEHGIEIIVDGMP